MIVYPYRATIDGSSGEQNTVFTIILQVELFILPSLLLQRFHSNLRADLF